MTTVYLAGPINGCTDSEAYDWRDDLAARLNEIGIDTISPMSRDYRGKEDESVEEIVEGDKEDIDNSDIIVAFCPKPSVGTSMEVIYGWYTSKTVIVFAPPGSPISPWLRYHSDAVLAEPDEVVQHILEFR